MAQTDKSEDTAAVTLKFGDLTAGFGKGRSKLGDKVGGEVASQIRTLFEGVMTEAFRDQLTMTGSTPIQIDLAIDAIANAAGERAKAAGFAAFDEAVASDTPLALIALGSSNPGKGALESFRSEVRPAMDKGVDSLFGPGDTMLDVLPKFISYDLRDIDLDLVDGATFALETYLETGDPQGLVSWLNGEVVIENLQLTAPLDFMSQIGGNEGTINIRVKDITFGGEFIAGVSASIGISQPIDFGAYRVEVFAAAGSWFYDPVTNEKNFGFSLSAFFTW